MTDILVTSPYHPFTLPTQFKAVFNGYIYCGTVDAVDPSVSQVQVYLVNESGNKVPVAQPLRTNAGGFLVYNGQPAKFVTSSNHSLLVRDSLGGQLWYAPNMAEIDPAAASFLAIEALRRSYAEAGYNLVDGSFELGGTLVNANDVLLHEADGTAYNWDGVFPGGGKVVPQNSTPATSGGLGANAWIPRTDAILREDLFENEMLNMSPLYSGAIGDGLANDTAGFTLLESETVGRVIDLGGKTYVVDYLPSKNTYTNGYFRINGNLVYPNGKQFGDVGVTANTRAMAYDNAASLIYQWRLTSTTLVGNDKNAVQSLSFDEKNRFIYAMYESPSTYGGSSVIYRMPMDWGGKLEKPLWGADGDVRVGHQGLSVENGRDGNTYLWATKRFNATVPASNDPQSGCKVIRFPVDNVPNYSSSGGNAWEGRGGVYFENVQEFILWPLADTTQNAQATISHDQRFLLSKMNDTTGYVIRVFSLDMLVLGGAGDYSTKYLHEFHVNKVSIDPIQGVDIQSMACDGQSIYFHGGRTSASPTAHVNLQVYDLWGNYITGNTVSNLGYSTQEAAFPGTTILEDEGMAFKYINGVRSLVVHMAGGEGGDRIQWLYALNMNIGDFRGTGTRSALVTTSPVNGLDIAYQRHLQWAMGGIDQATGAMTQNMFIDGSKIALGNGDDYADKKLSLESIGTVGYPNLHIDGNQAHIRRNASNAPLRVTYARSRNPVKRGSTALLSSDAIFEINAVADDGASNWSSGGGVTCAQITARAIGTISPGIVPTDLRFGTMNQAGTLAFRWSIDPDGTLRPSTNAVNDFGSASFKPNNIFAVNGTIQTSDATYKSEKEQLSADEIAAAQECLPLICKYKMLSAVSEKGFDNARYHFGIIAQDVIVAFAAHGLDALKYGAVGCDEWEATPDIYRDTEELTDKDGNVIRASERVLDTPAREAGSMYSVRYDELSMFIIKGLSAKVDNFETRLAALESGDR